MPNDYNQYQPYTGFFTQDANTAISQDLGQRYVTKSYLLDVYPNIASQLGNRTSPGLFMWGRDTIPAGFVAGQLGLSSAFNRSSPVQVGTLTNWKQVSCGTHHTGCVKTDGTLWTWGRNTLYPVAAGNLPAHGELGLGDTTLRSSPVQVGTLTDWKQLSCGQYFTACVKTDGTLWLWGGNDYGQLGLGDITYRSSPVQVGTLTNWKQIDASGTGHTACVKTDGTLWTWGNNVVGELGLGNTTNRSSPVQVGTLTNWKQVDAGSNFTACVKTDGTLWSWGSGSFGRLGLGNTTSRSSPLQIGTLTDWKQTSAGGGFTACIKTNGTLWTWGSNFSGELGLSDTTSRSSPVQVGTLTNWKEVSCGGGFTACVKTDGTLWIWGSNTYGQLGLGNTTSISSPVQIGILTNWKLVSAGGYHTGCNLDSTF